MLWYCFALGLNNFRGGRGRKMAEIATDIDKAFAESRTLMRLEGWFGPTGNIAVTTAAETGAGSLAQRLEQGTKRRWATIPSDQLDTALDALTEWLPPPAEERVRWTPGLAFALGDTSVSDTDTSKTDRAYFRWIAPTIIAAYKRDLLDDRGKLDTNRLGGWGVVSGDLHALVGGVWTARSARPLEGIRRVASQKGPSSRH